MQKDKFMVIGSNSFSGSYCVDLLLRKGYFVIGVSRSSEPNKIFLPYKWCLGGEQENIRIKNFLFKKIDLNKDLRKLINIFDEYEITHVINFAAQGMVSESWLNPNNWYQTNLISQVALHDELRKKKKLKKYLHFTTPEVYGDTKNKWISESKYFSPTTPYAVSRAACDMHLESFRKAYNFPVVYTRAANVYGPGQQLYRIIPRTILSCLSGEKLKLHGRGVSERSFIYIKDAIKATVDICLESKPGSSFHISTNEAITIKYLVNKICNLLSVNFEKVVTYSDERLGKDQSYFLDSKKLRKEFCWDEEYKLDDGIQSTIKWVKENYNVIKNMSWNYIHKE